MAAIKCKSCRTGIPANAVAFPKYDQPRSGYVTPGAGLLSLACFCFLATGCCCGSETDSRKPSSEPDPAATRPAPSASSARPAPSSSSAPSSAFDTLWASASERDAYRPYLALKQSKEAYCGESSCGDQFEPYKQYKQDLEDGKTIRDLTWKTEVSEGFGNIAFRGNIGPGAFDVKRSVIPFNITWPISLGSGQSKMEAAKRRLPLVVDGLMWQETSEKIADLKFADGAAARTWKEGGYRTARLVFRITDVALGNRNLLIIKILGMQLRDGDRIFFEDLATPQDAGTAKPGTIGQN